MDVVKLKSTLLSHFSHKFPDDMQIEITQLEETNELLISFFWNNLNGLNWKESKTFQFKEEEYPIILETQIKPFVLLR